MAPSFPLLQAGPEIFMEIAGAPALLTEIVVTAVQLLLSVIVTVYDPAGTEDKFWVAAPVLQAKL